MNNQLVSVIIPVYNTGHEAVTIINDLLKGSYQNIEIIVVDDGSKDGSFEILSKIKDKKVKLFKKENGGASSARNYGLKKAQGDLISFVDSDDNVKKDFIKKLVEAIGQSKTVLAVTGVSYKKLQQHQMRYVYLDRFEKKPNDKIETFVLRSLIHDGRMYPVFNKIFKGDIIRREKIIFDETLKFAEDTKFVLDYLKKAGGEISFVLEPLYVYNYGTSTSSVKGLEGDWKNWEKAFSNLKKWVGNTNLTQKFLLRVIRIKWRLSWIRINHG